MAGWKKWLTDLPATLLGVLLITLAGMGGAHPDRIRKKQVKTAAHALARLMYEPIRAVWRQ